MGGKNHNQKQIILGCYLPVFTLWQCRCTVTMPWSVLWWGCGSWESKRARIPHYLLWVGNILFSQMYRPFITFWPVELSCGRLGASHLSSDSDSRLTDGTEQNSYAALATSHVE